MKKLKLKGIKALSKDMLKSIVGGGGYGCSGPLMCLPAGCICGSGTPNLQDKCCSGMFCRRADNDPNLGVCLYA